ncbi:MAG: hypothetical protein V8S95_02445 [Odoribacter sp.]
MNKDELFREVDRPVLYALEAMLQEHPRYTGRGYYCDQGVSEPALKSCVDEYVALITTHREVDGNSVVPRTRFIVGTFPKLHRPFLQRWLKVWFTSMQQKHANDAAVSDFIIHLHTGVDAHDV